MLISEVLLYNSWQDLYTSFGNIPLDPSPTILQNKLPFGWQIYKSNWVENSDVISEIIELNDNDMNNFILDQMDINNRVIFKNIFERDVEDIHVHERSLIKETFDFVIKSGKQKFEIIDNVDSLIFDGVYSDNHDEVYAFELPLVEGKTTLFDFIRICYLSGIDLELSEYVHLKL